MDILDYVLDKLEKSGMQVNTVKWESYHDSYCCLLFMVTWDGIKPQSLKVNLVM